MISNADGTEATIDLMQTLWHAHDASVNGNNSLWTPGSVESFIFSGDALQTANQENHNLCCVRAGNLIEGYSSAYNFYPISNNRGGDKHPNLEAVLARHLPVVRKAVLDGGIGREAEFLLVMFFVTGDLAFLNSFVGMNPPGSLYGNPWCWIDEDNVVY